MRWRRPRIGVTGPDAGGLSAWVFTAHAVRGAGGRPVRIRPGRPRGIDDLDGLVIGGGADVGPDLYGEERRLHLDELAHEGVSGWRRWLGVVLAPAVLAIRRALTTDTTGLDAARDRLEKALLRDALQRGIPILGICRGMQLLNVVTGGNLHQSLEGFYTEHPELRSVLPRKAVSIAPDSNLRRALGMTEARVNALHSQAIDRLGAGMRVSARDPNGIIQAIEHEHAPFVVGVQWHPEYIPQRSEQRALFAGLVEAADASMRRPTRSDASSWSQGLIAFACGARRRRQVSDA
jgi:putative glutamine amidotransferase